MAAGDRPNAVGHGDNGEAERARDPQKIDRRRPRSHASDHRRPTTEEHQGESADKLGDLLGHFRSLPWPAPTAAKTPCGEPRQPSAGQALACAVQALAARRGSDDSTRRPVSFGGRRTAWAKKVAPPLSPAEPNDKHRIRPALRGRRRKSKTPDRVWDRTRVPRSSDPMLASYPW
jgi:hypothetical protein